MIDLQPVILFRVKRRSIRISPRNVGWVLLAVATAVLWIEVGVLAAADLMREPIYTYNSEVLSYAE
jgi:hypothetical protein